jgi:hypothetical protein
MSVQSEVSIPEQSSAPRERRWGARSIVSLLVFVLATVLLVPGLVGHWGHRTVIDGERYIQTVGPLINQPEIQEALATAVTDAVVQKLESEKVVENFLGNIVPNDQLTGLLAGPISAGINSLVGQLVTSFIQSDEFEKIWIEVNKAAQKGVVLVLEGEPGGPVSLQGDEIVLDTSAVAHAIQQHLVDAGITVAGNITLPENDRQIVLFSSPALKTVRTIYGLTSPILEYLPLIIAILFAGSIVLARRRARTVVATGVVLLAGAVLLLIGINAGETVVVNQTAGTPWEAASAVFYSTLLDYLVGGTEAIVALGIIVIAAGWFGGRTQLAVKVRGHMTAGLADLSVRLTGGKPGPLSGTGLTAARWVVYAIGVLLLLVSSLLVATTVLWICALVGGLITLVQLLSGSGAAADTPALEAALDEPAALSAE